MKKIRVVLSALAVAMAVVSAFAFQPKSNADTLYREGILGCEPQTECTVTEGPVCDFEVFDNEECEQPSIDRRKD